MPLFTLPHTRKVAKAQLAAVTAVTLLASGTTYATATEEPTTAGSYRAEQVGDSDALVKETDRLIVTFAEGTSTEERQIIVDRALDDTGALDAAEIVKDSVGEDATTGVIEADHPLSEAEQQSAIEALEADPGVLAAEPDQLVRAVQSLHSTATSEPLYGTLWNFRAANVAPAWHRADGAGTTIAVVDTGITYHPDLAPNLVAGYDFISDDAYARDGGGRDADPTDIGTFSGSTPSNWHGTHVAGIAAAAAQGSGLAGVAPRAKIQPVRVLGINGWGYASDIADGIAWASGGNVPGAPRNATPATVVNASLAWPSDTCPVALDAAIKGAYSRGVPVVVAAGNAGANANAWTPSNCYFAIVVGATNSVNTMTGYSNWGSTLDILAPGGTRDQQVNSTSNAGRTTATTATFAGLYGTSQAAPLVAGTVALMKQANPSMTIEQIRNTLKDTGITASGYRQVNTGAAVAASKASAPTHYFKDVAPGDQFYSEIMWLAQKGITTGWRVGIYQEYRPLNTIERGAMAAFFYRLAGSPAFTAPRQPTFSDVPAGHQFYKEIEWMAAQGITTGYMDDTFRPSAPVNRDAMAAFFYRFAGSPAYKVPAHSTFTDLKPQDQFYKEVSWLASKGITQGWPDGSFRPLEPINRDAMAAFIYRYSALG